MTTKKHQLVFQIEGAGVSPESVKSRDLFEIVFLVEQSLEATARNAGAKDTDDLWVSIVAVNDGSDKMTLAMSERMFTAAKKVSHCIANDDFSTLTLQSQASIRKLWNRAKTKDWTFNFLPPASGNGIVPASIAPQREILRPGEVSGPTTIYGRLNRVGGSHPPTANLQLISGEQFTATLKSTIIAEELGHKLYQVVGLEGEATWDLDDWKLTKFHAYRVTEYEDTDIVTAFDNLAQAAGDAWDEVDPNEYIAQLRAD